VWRRECPDGLASLALKDRESLCLLEGAPVIGQVEGILVFRSDFQAEAFHRESADGIGVVAIRLTLAGGEKVLVPTFRTEVVGPGTTPP